MKNTLFLVLLLSMVNLACTKRLIPKNAPSVSRIAPFLPESIVLPVEGFVKIDAKGEMCQPAMVNDWERRSNQACDIWVNADGPQGSGRYWNITLSVVPQGVTEIKSGICFGTSTLGWRTLQNFEDRALPWIEDVDGDGESEFIVWSSFTPENNKDAAFGQGLIAWIYRLNKVNVLVLDWPLTRKFAARIAAAYRQSLSNNELSDQRAVIAGQLEAFAREGGTTK